MSTPIDSSSIRSSGSSKSGDTTVPCSPTTMIREAEIARENARRWKKILVERKRVELRRAEFRKELLSKREKEEEFVLGSIPPRGARHSPTNGSAFLHSSTYQEYKRELRADHERVLCLWLIARESEPTRYERRLRNERSKGQVSDPQANPFVNTKKDPPTPRIAVIDSRFRGRQYLADRNGSATLYGEEYATKIRRVKLPSDGLPVIFKEECDNYKFPIQLTESDSHITESDSQGERDPPSRIIEVDGMYSMPQTAEVWAVPKDIMVDTFEETPVSQEVDLRVPKESQISHLRGNVLESIEHDESDEGRGPQSRSIYVESNETQDFDEQQDITPTSPNSETTDLDTEAQQQNPDQSPSPTADSPISTESSPQVNQQHQDLTAQSSSSPTKSESSVEEVFDAMSIDSSQKEAGYVDTDDVPDFAAPTPSSLPSYHGVLDAMSNNSSQNETGYFGSYDLPLDAPTPQLSPSYDLPLEALMPQLPPSEEE